MAVDHKQKQELNSGVSKAKRVWRVWLLGDSNGIETAFGDRRLEYR
jgi:hypothetical protein